MADDATTTDDNAGGEDDKTFTQAEVDRIIKDRLVRAKAEPPSDYAELQAKAAKLAELESANQTELEKIMARAEAAEKKAADADERARKSNLRSAVTAAASEAGAVDIDAVFALLPQDAVTFGDDGQVTGAEDAVKALLESKPYLVGQAATPPPKPTGSADGGSRGSGSGPRQLRRDELSSMTPEQIVEADNAGLLDDVKAGV